MNDPQMKVPILDVHDIFRSIFTLRGKCIKESTDHDLASHFYKRHQPTDFFRSEMKSEIRSRRKHFFEKSVDMSVWRPGCDSI